MTIINVRPNPYYWGTKILDGNTYRLNFWWNLTTGKWYMDIIGQNNSVDIRSKALTCGHNILASSGYEDILGTLYVIDNQGANEDPNFDDMGSRWTLEYTPLAVAEPVNINVSEITDILIYVDITNGALNPADEAEFAAFLNTKFVQGQDVTWQTIYAYGEIWDPGTFDDDADDYFLGLDDDPTTNDPIVIAVNEIAIFSGDSISFTGEG